MDNIPIIVMGVAGSGKTSVGEALAKRLGVPFRDADEFHPKANIEKMSAGIPLTDEDRWPWLDAIGRALADADGRLIVACSALRRVYRERLDPHRRTAGDLRLARRLEGDDRGAHEAPQAPLHAAEPARQPVCHAGSSRHRTNWPCACRSSRRATQVVAAALAALPAARERALMLSAR